MTTYNLAQVNIAKRLAPIDDPIMQDFVNNVERINAIADMSVGFNGVYKMRIKMRQLVFFRTTHWLLICLFGKL